MLSHNELVSIVKQGYRLQFACLKMSNIIRARAGSYIGLSVMTVTVIEIMKDMANSNRCSTQQKHINQVKE